jgi:hypothetical protein
MKDHLQRIIMIGLNASSSSKIVSNFHLITSEYVNYIQIQRRIVQNERLVDNLDKEGVSNANSNRNANNPSAHMFV